MFAKSLDLLNRQTSSFMALNILSWKVLFYSCSFFDKVFWLFYSSSKVGQSSKSWCNREVHDIQLLRSLALFKLESVFLRGACRCDEKSRGIF